ncbi:OLC1v1017587C1 [Oldenlandia corymbosa var. corymbosa]|uniref:OLC1v1017587C1 n=1 Tax=Oldenlandia corymbosa var. corymbosa TaxID=529605 RepID=A0AAV1E9R9_OLDCO|nr:OLC1v1017587C1 [Oldenlandia corymbosa var. corymbosa]
MFNSTFPSPPPQGQAIAVHDNGGGRAAPNTYPIIDYNLIHQYFSYHLDLDQPPKIINSTNTMFEEYYSNHSSFTSTTTIDTPFVSSSQKTSNGSSSAGSFDGLPMDRHDDDSRQLDDECKKDEKKAKVEGQVIALRTQTELETLDDGFKWRKYGKKMVKSNPNPRSRMDTVHRNPKILVKTSSFK